MHIHIHRGGPRGRYVRDQEPGAEIRYLMALEQYNAAKAAQHAACGTEQAGLHRDISAHHENARSYAREARGHLAAGSAEPARLAWREALHETISGLTKRGDLYEE
jgi:hypothetical protein